MDSHATVNHNKHVRALARLHISHACIIMASSNQEKRQEVTGLRAEEPRVDETLQVVTVTSIVATYSCERI